jgi:uncharacterized protein (TIGR02145 family)
MKLKLFILIICWLALMPAKAQTFDFSSIEKSTVTDYDGNVYPTIKIGDYWWMAENLRTTHYNDGTRIHYLGTGGIADYDNAEQGYAYPNFDSTKIATYGLLYTWYVAIDTANNGVCPAGWTLSDTTQWFEMARLLGGTVLYDNVTNGTETTFEGYGATLVGQYLKSDNGVLWRSAPSISNDCNQAGMNIVPAGYIQYTASNYFGRVGNYWTPNYVHADRSGQGRRTIWFSYDTHDMTTARYHNANPTSVRCVKRHVDTSLKYTLTITPSINGNLVVLSGTDILTSGQTLPANTGLTIKTTPDNGYKLDSVIVNGSKITSNTYVVNANTTVSALFSPVTTAVSQLYTEPLNVYASDGVLYIQSTLGAQVRIYGITGQAIASAILTGTQQAFALGRGIYIVKVYGTKGSANAKCVVP